MLSLVRLSSALLEPAVNFLQRSISPFDLPKYGLNTCQIRGHSSTSPCVQYICDL